MSAFGEKDIRLQRPKKNADAFIDRLWNSVEYAASKNRLLASAAQNREKIENRFMGDYFHLFLDGDSPQIREKLITSSVREQLEEWSDQQKQSLGREKAKFTSLIRNLKPYQNGPPILNKGKSKGLKGGKVGQGIAAYEKISSSINQKCDLYSKQIKNFHQRIRLDSLPIELKIMKIVRWMNEEPNTVQDAIEMCVVGRRWMQICGRFHEFGIAPDSLDSLQKIVDRRENDFDLNSDKGLLKGFKIHPEKFIDPVSPLKLPSLTEGGSFLNSFQTDFVRKVEEVYFEERPQLWVVGNVGVGKTTAIPIAASKLNEGVSQRDPIRVFVICPKWWAVFDLVGICLTLGVPVSIIDKVGKEQFAWQTCGRGKDVRVPWVTVGIPELLGEYLRRSPEKLVRHILAIDEVTQSPSSVTLDLLSLPFRVSMLISANLPIDRSGPPTRMKMEVWDEAMKRCGVGEISIIDSTNTPVGMKIICEGKRHLDPLEGISSKEDLVVFVDHLTKNPSLRRFFTVEQLSNVMDAAGGADQGDLPGRLVKSYQTSSYFDQGRVFDLLKETLDDITEYRPGQSENVSSVDLSTPEGLLKSMSCNSGQGLYFTPNPCGVLRWIVHKIVDPIEWRNSRERYFRHMQELEAMQEKQLRSINGDVDDMDQAYLEREKDEIINEAHVNLVSFLPPSVRKIIPKNQLNIELIIKEVFEDESLNQFEAMGLVLGIGAYVHSSKGNSYSSIVQSRASNGDLRIVLSSLDPQKGAVFALNAPFSWCSCEEVYFEGGNVESRWGILSQAFGRVGRRGQSYHATCYLGQKGGEYISRLLRGEEDASFRFERDALEKIAEEWLA